MQIDGAEKKLNEFFFLRKYEFDLESQVLSRDHFWCIKSVSHKKNMEDEKL